jgi:cell division protein FtsL
LVVGDVDVQDEVVPEVEEKLKKKSSKVNKLIADIMGGDIFSKDGFVGLFPFFVYIVFLSMLYITNVYIAEDVSRDIAKSNRRIEDLHVEYVYLKSEITKITKQSNMVNMLKNKGIKESVEPLRKIVVEKEGGRDED